MLENSHSSEIDDSTTSDFNDNSPNPTQYEHTSRSLYRLNSITNIDFL
jgi:hypothetical protein